MTVLHHLIGMAGQGLSLPEYRQIELYTKKKALSFAEESPSNPVLAAVAKSCLSFMVLDAFLDSINPGLDGKTGWLKYLALPRDTLSTKLIAEVFRILRIVRIATLHPNGRVDVADGIIKMGGVVNRFSLILDITFVGLTLLESFVAYAIGSTRQPYPEAYVDAMLAQYFTDIMAEIKNFADEDRILYQFRQKIPFNRHFRFDCDNPKVEIKDGSCRFVMNEIHRDPFRTPMDFFAIMDGALHIIPVEALSDGTLPLSDLPRWRARTPDGISLPANFRPRFGRQDMVAGQPMT